MTVFKSNSLVDFWELELWIGVLKSQTIWFLHNMLKNKCLSYLHILRYLASQHSYMLCVTNTTITTLASKSTFAIGTSISSQTIP